MGLWMPGSAKEELDHQCVTGEVVRLGWRQDCGKVVHRLPKAFSPSERCNGVDHTDCPTIRGEIPEDIRPSFVDRTQADGLPRLLAPSLTNDTVAARCPYSNPRRIGAYAKDGWALAGNVTAEDYEAIRDSLPPKIREEFVVRNADLVRRRDADRIEAAKPVPVSRSAADLELEALRKELSDLRAEIAAKEPPTS